MEYTKEDLKIMADAWAQEVAELEKDKEELRELCELINIATTSTSCASEKQEDRISELWEKHMEGGEG